MPKDMFRLPGWPLCVCAIVFAALGMGACSTSRPTGPSGTERTEGEPAQHTDHRLAGYFDLLSELATADPESQSLLLDELYVAARDRGSGHARLEYALALGSSGSINSKPAEAADLLHEISRQKAGLGDAETALAAAFELEYEKRARLEQAISASQQTMEQQRQLTNAAAQSELEGLAQENARLTRERDELQQKLDAIAEIERSLLKREPETTVEPGQP